MAFRGWRWKVGEFEVDVRRFHLVDGIAVYDGIGCCVSPFEVADCQVVAFLHPLPTLGCRLQLQVSPSGRDVTVPSRAAL